MEADLMHSLIMELHKHIYLFSIRVETSDVEFQSTAEK